MGPYSPIQRIVHRSAQSTSSRPSCELLFIRPSYEHFIDGLVLLTREFHRSYHLKTPSRATQTLVIQTLEGETELDVAMPRVREMGVSPINSYVEAKYLQFPRLGEIAWDDLRCVLDDSDEMIATCIHLFERNGGKFKIARENEWIEIQKSDLLLSMFLRFHFIARHLHPQSEFLPHRGLSQFQKSPPSHPNPLTSR